jgi:phosphate transport system substrate-binding protein
MHRAIVSLLILTLSSPLMARDYVTVVGSFAIYPFMIAMVERFYRDEHQPAPVVESTGTGGGIRAFCAGLNENQPDIVMTARKMTASEKKYCIKHDIPNPLEIEIGLDASVLVTFSKPFSITMDELRQGLSQRIQLWSDVNSNLPDEKIRIMGPPTTAGVFETFSDILLKPYKLKLRTDDTYVEVIGHERVVVKKLDLNRKTLGLLSYTFLSQLPEKLKPLQINGVTPNDATITTGKYPLVRKSYLYIKTERLKTIKSLGPFLCYILSDSVSGPDGYLKKYGFIPLSPQLHKEQQEKIMSLVKTCQWDPKS